jgi:hypothetical protein
LAAWLGLVPKQYSSGGKQILLGISKRGDTYLRTLLIHGARAVIRFAENKAEPESWLRKLMAREGAKFWLNVVTELKNRGVQDIFIACVDGLKGFPEAIETVYPHAIVQLCIVHMVRNSLNYVRWNKRKEVAADLRLVYSAATIDEAEQALADFEDKWNNVMWSNRPGHSS